MLSVFHMLKIGPFKQTFSIDSAMKKAVDVTGLTDFGSNAVFMQLYELAISLGKHQEL
jgi:hypothetical protein